MYIYPANLKAKASLLLWSMKDLLITGVLAILGVLLLSQTKSLILLVAAAAYAVLAIRFDEVSILDYLRYAWRFCVSRQQLFYWRLTL